MAALGWEAERRTALLLLEFLGCREAEGSWGLLSHPLAFPLIPPRTQNAFSEEILKLS